MHRLISAVLVGTLVPFAIDVSALPQAAPAVQKPQAPPAVQKPQAADSQAPVTAEQVRAAIDKLGNLDFPTRSAAARTVRRADAAVAVPALLSAVKQHSDQYVRFRALVIVIRTLSSCRVSSKL
jgi:hypothetical protein